MPSVRSLALLTLSFLPATLCAPSTAGPFNLTHLFNATLYLGKPSKPVPVPGGYLVNEPITGGIVKGSAINATIQGGFAHPPVYQNGTLQVPMIDVYGVSDDGFPFYIHETGIGSNPAQVTRIEINIGGTKYSQLNEGYILASVNANQNRTEVAVQGWLVHNDLP